MMALIRRLPLIATILVLIAVGVMVRLGVWQLDRMHEKEALLEKYAAAAADSSVSIWPASPSEAEAMLYRKVRLTCSAVLDASTIAGKNASGQSGLTQVVTCPVVDGGKVLVALGWSHEPRGTGWQGGEVTGMIAPGPRLVADPPVAGLEPNAKPDPSEIPNNHFAYAVQWFLFAVVALVIYALAVRKRLAGGGEGG